MGSIPMVSILSFDETDYCISRGPSPVSKDHPGF